MKYRIIKTTCLAESFEDDRLKMTIQDRYYIQNRPNLWPFWSDDIDGDVYNTLKEAQEAVNFYLNPPAPVVVWESK